MFATFPDAYDTSDVTRATRQSTLKAELDDSRYHRAPRPTFIEIHGDYHQLTHVQSIDHDRHCYLVYTTKGHELRRPHDSPVLTFPDPLPATIVVRVKGGLVQNVHIPRGASVRIVVRDYDTETATETTKDPKGRECVETVWEPQS